MSHFVLIELGRFNKIRGRNAFISAEVYFDLSAAAPAEGVGQHVFVELVNGMHICSRSDIKHQAVLRLYEFA